MQRCKPAAYSCDQRNSWCRVMYDRGYVVASRSSPRHKRRVVPRWHASTPVALVSARGGVLRDPSFPVRATRKGPLPHWPASWHGCRACRGCKRRTDLCGKRTVLENQRVRLPLGVDNPGVPAQLLRPQHGECRRLRTPWLSIILKRLPCQ
jgi:hypothetical protein